MKTSRVTSGTPHACTTSLSMMAGKSLTGAALIFFMALLQSASLSHAQNPGERIWTTPPFGAFYSLQMGGTNYPPFPFLPFDPIDVPTYVLDPIQHTYIYDDSEIDYEELNSLQTLNSSPPPPPGEGGGSNGGAGHTIAYDYRTNDLWLEIYDVDPVNSFSYLALHGTKTNLYYELQQKPNLGEPSWEFSTVPYLFNGTGTNLMYFDPTGNSGRPMTYYRAVEGFPVVSVETDRYIHEPRETNSATGSPGAIGIFVITLSDVLSSNLTVVFTLTGTAQNGVDYTTIPLAVTVLAGSDSTNIVIEPM